MGKASMTQQAKVVPSSAPAQRQVKGLKQHIHTEQYQNIRDINRQTCVNGLLSLVLAVISNEIHWTKTKIIESADPQQGPITEPAFFNLTTDIIKCLVTVNVLLVVLGIYRY